MDMRTQWSMRLAGAAVLLAGTVSPVAGQDAKPVMRVSSSSSARVAPSAVAQAAQRGDLAAVRSLIAERADVNVPLGDGMTALHWAAERGDAAMANALIKAGAKLTPVTRNGGYTPLHVAARSASGAVVQALLAAGADPGARTETGATALHLAAQSGDVVAVKALVAKKADVNATEPAWGQTPLMFAAAADRAAAVTALLAAGADASIRTRTIDLTEELSREQAAARKRNEVLFSYLPEKTRDSVIKAFEKQAAEQAAQARLRAGGAPGAPVGAPTASRGGTPAENQAAAPAGGAAAAAAAGAAAAAKPAADSAKGFKVGVQAPPVTALTPSQVQEAILAGRTVYNPSQKVDGKVETIIPADTTNGFQAGYEATVGSMGGLSALLHAARQGNTAAAMALIDGGADINEVAVSDSVSPLLMATINGQFDLAMALIKRGANAKIESIHGLTPLYAAINTTWHPKSRYPQPQALQTQKTTHLELMDALIKAGADVNVRLRKNLWFFGFSNCGNANCGLEALDGTTAFWRATYAVDLEAMKMLKAAGANDTIPQYKAPTTARRGGGGGFGRPPATPADPSIDSASKAVPPGIGVYPIHAAAGVGYGNGFAGNSHRHAPDGWMPVMKYLVEELHHDVNQRDINGYTPLHHAAARGDNEMINYLVSKGADPKAVGRDFRTTVDMANGPVERLRPFPETIQLLEKMGAKNSHRCVSC